MCGIVGWVDWEADLTQEKELFTQMTRRLSARGPDAEGYWVSKEAALGHRRLIVVDPAGGAQPMLREFGEKRFVLVYNGELYNTAEVRNELIKKGHSFRSYSDTEVVLIAYIEWGRDCVNHFNGIFAFAIWDEARQELFMARDHLGVKPLFYAERGQGFWFASEIKALLAHPAIKPEVTQDGLAEIFGLGPARIPGSGVFKGIFELRPGYCVNLNRRGLKITQYWSLRSEPYFDNLNNSVEKVRELVFDSIRRQLVSDVPVCAFLSGGLDSSIITAVAAREMAEKEDLTLQTFSLDYVGNDQYFKANDFQPHPDRPWVTKVAGFLSTNHHEVLVDNTQLAGALKTAMLARDLPGMADIDASLYLFCREIKKEATVALSGECADEIFGGYPWFFRQDALESGTFPWAPYNTIREQILAPELRVGLDLPGFINKHYQQALLEVPRLDGETAAAARRRELFYLNIHWFMALLLERKDRMSMASGLEVRVPYCDHRLVEYLWNLPWEYKSCDNREKGILRRAVSGLLPEEVIYRRKSPYPKTHHPGYLTALQKELQVILNSPESPLNALIDIQFVKGLLLGEGIAQNRPWFGQLMTETQLIAYLIQIDLWLREYRITIS